jgi:GT2 family glycosyltransferase
MSAAIGLHSYRSVGVVIPTYNRDDLLERCLERLACQTLQSSRTIIVDNGTRSSIPAFLNRFENLEWIPMLSNRGTAVAFNRGIASAAGCEYVFLLNNDIELEADCLDYLVQALEKGRAYSMAVPKLSRWSDPRYLDGAGDEILLGGGAYHVGSGELDVGQYDAPRAVFSACAAAALYRASLFDDIGGFDEDFFAYREDVDLGLRAQLRRHRCIYVPRARARHHGSATMGKPAHSWIIRLSTRNQILAILKTYPRYTLLRLLPQLLLFQVLWLAFSARRNTLGGYCLGIADALRALPKTWAKRCAIQSKKLLNSQSFLRLLQESERRIWQAQKNSHNSQPSKLLGFYFWFVKPLPEGGAAAYRENE